MTRLLRLPRNNTAYDSTHPRYNQRLIRCVLLELGTAHRARLLIHYIQELHPDLFGTYGRVASIEHLNCFELEPNELGRNSQVDAFEHRIDDFGLGRKTRLFILAEGEKF